MCTIANAELNVKDSAYSTLSWTVTIPFVVSDSKGHEKLVLLIELSLKHKRTTDSLEILTMRHFSSWFARGDRLIVACSYCGQLRL